MSNISSSLKGKKEEIKYFDYSIIKKLINNIKNENKDKQNIILLTTGSYNPVHRMHLEILNFAYKYLKSLNKFNVLCGFISPSSDTYVKGKRPPLIPFDLRCKMIQTAIEEYNNEYKNKEKEKKIQINYKESNDKFQNKTKSKSPVLKTRKCNISPDEKDPKFHSQIIGKKRGNNNSQEVDNFKSQSHVIGRKRDNNKLQEGNNSITQNQVNPEVKEKVKSQNIFECKSDNQGRKNNKGENINNDTDDNNNSDDYLPIFLHEWEGSHSKFIDFPDVIYNIQCQLNDKVGKNIIKVIYVCGMDHYLHCIYAFNENVIAIDRKPFVNKYHHQSIPKRLIFLIKDENSQPYSSTSIKEYYKQGNKDKVKEITYPKVADMIFDFYKDNY